MTAYDSGMGPAGLPAPRHGSTAMDQLGATVALGSIVQAGWSFQLALRARGLGSTWTTLHLHNADAVAWLLDIPAGVTQVSLIPVAHTKGLDFRPAKRPPVEEITHWNRWGADGA